MSARVCANCDDPYARGWEDGIARVLSELRHEMASWPAPVRVAVDVMTRRVRRRMGIAA